MKKLGKFSAVAICVALVQGCGEADEYEYKHLTDSLSIEEANGYARELAAAQQRRNPNQEDPNNPQITVEHQNYAACFLDMFAQEQANYPAARMENFMNSIMNALTGVYRTHTTESMHSAQPSWQTPEGMVSHLHSVCVEEVGNPYDDDGL